MNMGMPEKSFIDEPWKIKISCLQRISLHKEPISNLQRSVLLDFKLFWKRIKQEMTTKYLYACWEELNALSSQEIGVLVRE